METEPTSDEITRLPDLSNVSIGDLMGVELDDLTRHFLTKMIRRQEAEPEVYYNTDCDDNA